MPKCDGYYGAAAQLAAANRRARDRKLIKHTELCKHVIERLKNGWTPEQIGNRMIHDQAPLKVCQETIYRYVYSREGMAQELWWYLPTHRMSRKTLAPDADHRAHKGLNNAIEVSHRPTHKREKIFGRFKSHRQAQRFLSARDQINLLFRPRRYQLNATSYRHARSDAFSLWADYTVEMVA